MPEPSAHRCPRADAFGLLPEEDQAAWTRHVLDLRAGYRPVDPIETGLVTAIAAAMWMEIRADRLQAEVLADIRPAGPGRSHGSDLQDRDHAAALSSVLRLATAAGCASARAQRAFLAHRKARAAGLIGPALERTPASARTCEPERPAQSRTSEPKRGARPRTCEPERGARPRTGEPETSAPARTCEPEPAAWAGPPPANDADPVDALRRRILSLLAGPGPRRPDEHDLAAAIRAARLPGAPPYRGPLDRALLEQALEAFTLDGAALCWLAGSGAGSVSG